VTKHHEYNNNNNNINNKYNINKTPALSIIFAFIYFNFTFLLPPLLARLCLLLFALLYIFNFVSSFIKDKSKTFQMTSVKYIETQFLSADNLA